MKLFRKLHYILYTILHYIQIHSVQKVPRIDHSKRLFKEIIKNVFDAKLAPLISILRWSSGAI